MAMTLWEHIKDWYLTRKTGYTKAEREYRAWYESLSLATTVI